MIKLESACVPGVQGEDRKPFVVKDAQLVTGQNPESSEELALCVANIIKPGAAIAWCTVLDIYCFPRLWAAAGGS